MSVAQYLKRKYGFSSNAKVPTAFLVDELHIDLQRVKEIVRCLLHRKSFPDMIAFDEFCLICQQCLEGI